MGLITITISDEQAGQLELALVSHIASLEKRIRTIDADYADDEERRIKAHNTYAKNLAASKELLEIIVNRKQMPGGEG